MAVTIARDDKFYLDDGDIVLQSAPDTQGTVTLYRVKKSGLAFNSPVFADMFGLSAGEGVQDIYDDVPLIVMSDTEEELSSIMLALYEPA